MTVSQALEKIEPEGTCRIGCRYGTGFIYNGKKADLDLGKLNQQMLDKISEAAETAADGCDRIYKNEMEKRLKGWIQIQDRLVLEFSPSLLEPSSIIIVDGNDKGEQYSYETTGTDWDRKACESLVLKIYKSICSDLVKLYKKVNVSESDKIDMEWLEWFLRRDRYCILSGPEEIIAACKYRAGRADILQPVMGNYRTKRPEKIIPAEKGDKLKAKMARYGLRQYVIAKMIGTSEGNLSVRLRCDMDEDFYDSVNDAINTLIEEMEGAQCM